MTNQTLDVTLGGSSVAPVEAVKHLMPTEPPTIYERK